MDKKSKNLKNQKLRILIIEDSEDDALLLERELSKAYEFTSERVYSASALTKALKKDWDVIISDYQMPRFTALNALEILQKTKKDLPFIIVSGTIGEDVKAIGDQQLIQIVLQNLLNNSWKFTSKKKSVKIEFGTKKDVKSEETV